MAGQFHFDADTYLALIRSELPHYDLLQRAIAEATAGIEARAILDLGIGTGITAAQVWAMHPGADLTGIDASAEMLEHARSALPGATLVVSRLEDPFPAGDFDLVTSALAIHHLSAPGKADLFGRIAAVLRTGGRFVFADVVEPSDPDDRVTPINDAFDHPSTLAEQLRGLAAAGLRPTVVWNEKDLAVVAADKA